MAAQAVAVRKLNSGILILEVCVADCLYFFCLA